MWRRQPAGEARDCKIKTVPQKKCTGLDLPTNRERKGLVTLSIETRVRQKLRAYFFVVGGVHAVLGERDPVTETAVLWFSDF